MTGEQKEKAAQAAYEKLSMALHGRPPPTDWNSRSMPAVVKRAWIAAAEAAIDTVVVKT